MTQPPRPHAQVKKATTITYQTTIDIPAKELVELLAEAIDGYTNPVVTVRTYDSQRDGAQTVFEVKEGR